MATVYDNVRADRAQLHALVIGVGEYPHLAAGDAPNTLGLPPVASPPVSARLVGEWLLDAGGCAGAELGSIEFCASAGQRLNGADSSPADIASITNAVDAWSRRCDADAEQVGFFYFCGHGIEPLGETVLLANDFGSRPGAMWHGLINFTRTFDGMAGCKARRQYYFVDCCRQAASAAALDPSFSPAVLAGYGRGAPHKPGDQPRCRPIYYSTVPGSSAYAPAAALPSVYCDFLLDCLRKGTGTRFDGEHQVWNVTADSLGTALRALLYDANGIGGDQGGEAPHGASVLFNYDGDPVVKVRVAIAPAGGAGTADLSATSVAAPALEPVRGTVNVDTWLLELWPGDWKLVADFPATHGSYRRTERSASRIWPPLYTCPFTLNVVT